jgi:hypothetical protein
MGILFHASQMKKNMKQEMVLERLLELGVKETQTGKSVYELDYEDLLIELVLAEMRQVDVEHPDHKWFR